jgi:hypothetical protein
MPLTDDQKEVRRLRKSLRDLTQQVKIGLDRLDKAMAMPSTEARGKNIAAAANHINLHNDIAIRFGLTK